jgi:predicted permease
MRARPQFQDRTRVPSLLVESGSRGLFDPDSQTLRAGTILTIVVALMLLIVCANVANLMLARATTRRSEISLRLSMGAPRSRIIRQLLTESLLLASAGGALGLLINHWGRTLVPDFRSALVSDDLPVVNLGLLPELDWRIFAFVLALTVCTALIFGLVPALRGTSLDLATELKENSRSVSGRRSLLSRSLLIAQVAVSLTLLVGAGLFLRTVRNLRSVAVGFNPHHILTFHVSLRAIGGGDPARVTRLLDLITERAGHLPGVQSIGGTSAAYWQSQVLGTRPVYIPGASGAQVMDFIGISPGFLETMQIPLLNGRAPNVGDLPAPAKGVLINETAAARLFPGQDPIGRRLGFAPQNAGNLEIIGVVGDTKYGDVRAPAQPMVYMPSRQTSFVLRTAGEPMQLAHSIRDLVREIDPAVPVTDIETQEDLTNARIQPERLYAGFYTLFGVLALLLASIGLFGLMSYNVVQRTNELGVRMALGAQKQDVLRLVMRESIALVAVGVAAGVALAIAANRIIASLLYGLAPGDLSTIVVAILLMFAVAACAAYLPARRASTVDPLRALRHE